MNSTVLKKALPHVIAIVVFLIVAVIYCRPALEGKVVFQSDMLQYKGMAQQSFEYKEKHGHFPLWLESSFSGMPAYTIAMDHSAIHLGPVVSILSLWLPEPINYFFVACVCFYILMIVLRVNPWIGVLAALAYAYSTYDPVIIVTGHVTKMQAIAYAPGIFAGLFLLFRQKYIWGTVLMMLFFALQLSTNHLQIVYYTLLSLGVLTLFYIVYAFMQGQGKDAALAIVLACFAGLVGFGTSTLGNLPVQEYSKETMRGGRTELKNSSSKLESNNGLSKDYAFGWSYGIGETMTLAVPNVYGGGSGGKEIGDNSKFAEQLTQEFSVPEETGLQYANGSAYWGAQPFTSGPVYLGAIICFLAILGGVFVKGWQKWALLTITVVGIVLAWGKNFSGLNYFLFDHFPFYNKFRAPAMALVIPQLTVPLLAALGLNELISSRQPRMEIWKGFRKAAYITGGLLLILIGFYFMADYSGARDSQLKEQFVQNKMQQLSQGKQAGADVQQQAVATGNTLIRALQADRQSLYGSDLLRTILLIVAAAVLLGLYLKDKIKEFILLAGLIILSSYDLLAVGARYLSSDNYSDAADFDANLSPSPADLQIKNDPDKNFRVFDESSQSPFEDAKPSYHHNSLGGYSPAKLGLYQDLIENQLSKGNMQVFNMLNAKYFIQRNPQTGQPQAALNAAAFGPCWLVKAIHYVKDGNEEMKALDSINVRDTAIVQQQFASKIKFTPVADSTATIKLTENDNDKLTYEFNAATNQFAVFSEIYYDKGWDVFVDGNKADYCRVDYVLRGMAVPAGKHTIVFRFEPKSFATGNAISTWSSLILYLLLIGAIVMEFRKEESTDSMKPLSFVIITYNRPEDVLELQIISQLEDLEELVEEIIIVNNKSSVSYKPLEDFISAHPVIPFRYFLTEENLGVSRGRNYAIRQSHSPILVFLDDDALIRNSDVLPAIVDTFNKDPAPGIAAFKIYYYSTGEMQINAFPHKRFAERKDLPHFDTYYFSGAAHAIRRTVFEEAGYYPENFFYGMEEYDLSFRALDAGYIIRYTDAVVILHKESPTGRLTPREKRKGMWLNKSSVAWKYLPLRYFISTAFIWSLWYLVKTKGDIGGFFKGWGSIFRIPGNEKRRPVSPACTAYLKKVKARLAY